MHSMNTCAGGKATSGAPGTLSGCCRWTAYATRRCPDFYLSHFQSDFEAGLRMYRRSIDHMAVGKIEF